MLDYSVRRKKLYVYLYKKNVLRLVLVCSLLLLSSYYILLLFLPFSPSTCGLGIESHFSPSLLSFLESSVLSCKAVRSLFRYHLHINAARRLVGQHLMRKWQYPQIFVTSHSYTLFDIFSSTWLQSSSKALFWMNDEYTGYLRQKFRGDCHPRTGSSSSQALFTYPRRVILSLLAGRPRIFPYPWTEYWAWPFSYAGCIYEDG